MKCKFCKCTDEKACRGGCTWVAPTVCSRCVKPTGVEAFAIVSKVDDEVMVFDHEFEGKRYQFFAIAKTIEAAKEAAWDSPQRNDTRIEPVVISIKHNKPRKKSSGRKTSKA